MTNKTQATNQSVDAFLQTIEDSKKQKDTRDIVAIMAAISNCQPLMWGSSIIGFGRYAYHYESGRKGEFFILGISPRKQNITLYIMPGYQNYQHFMERLGKHKIGKSCLYIKRLADLDKQVLTQLLTQGWQDMLDRRIDV